MISSAVFLPVLAAALAGKPAANWQPIECKPGRFRIEFPGKPKEHKGYFKSGGETWWDTYSYSLQKDRVIYFVKCYVLTDKYPKIFSVTAYAKDERKKALSEANKRKAKILLDKETSGDAGMGHDLAYEYRTGIMVRAGWYVVGRKWYEIKVSGLSQGVRSADADRFMRSFKFDE
jgi:hypothetical protein